MPRWVILLHAHAHLPEGDPDDLIALQRAAAGKGIDAIVLTEQLLAQWEISLPVLRSFASWKVSRPSMARMGLTDFYRLAAVGDREVPEVTLIVAAEVAPYYRWEFPDEKGALTMWDWQKNLLVAGLGPKELDGLPVFGLHHPLISTHGFLWLLAVLLMGTGFLYLLNHMRWMRAAAVGVPLVLLLWSGPPASGTYSIYGPDPGIAPWQSLIDAAEAQGAFTMWTQVESPDDETFWKVHIRTARHPDVLVKSRGYDAWGAINPDRMQALRPGAEWDQAVHAAILDPSRGIPWGWGEPALHYPEQLGIKNLDQVLSVVWAPGKGTDDLLGALQAGRGYAVWSTQGGTRLGLDTYELRPMSGDPVVRSGERYAAAADPVLAVAWSSVGTIDEPITVRVISDGEVIAESPASADGALTLPLRGISRPGYVRLEIRSRSHLLLSNPIVLASPGDTP